MKRAYTFRIYPNDTQAKMLRRMISMCWRIWNDDINTRERHFEATGGYLENSTIEKYWRQARNDNPCLQIIPSDTVTFVNQKVRRAYEAAWRRKKAGEQEWGLPTQKPRKFYNSIPFRHSRPAMVAGMDERVSGYRLVPDRPGVARLVISGVGMIRVHYHRPLPCGATPKMIIIKEHKRNEWYATIQMDIPDIDPREHDGDIVGIDVGLTCAIALSNGKTVPLPRWYQETQTTRRVLSRKIDRQLRANNTHCYNSDGTAKIGVKPNKYFARLKQTFKKRADLDAYIARRRKLFWNQITDALTKDYRCIVIEDLSPKFMLQNKHLALHASNAAWGMFFNMLDYKADERGVAVIRVNPQYTSQTCSACGYTDTGNRKSQSVFHCDACGHAENADVNAAKNILKRVLSTEGDDVL